MVPPCSDRISRVPPYSRTHGSLRIRGCHPLWPAFPDRSASFPHATGLFRFRSPLLTESLLMSVPPGTEMFQFPGFASTHYVFMRRYPIGVGCPIRISTDQSLLAAPRGFSQRATSFIASWCQGIHRMPFSCSKITPSCTGTSLARRSNRNPARPPRIADALFSFSTDDPSHARPARCRTGAFVATGRTPLNSHPAAWGSQVSQPDIPVRHAAGHVQRRTRS